MALVSERERANGKLAYAYQIWHEGWKKKIKPFVTEWISDTIAPYEVYDYIVNSLNKVEIQKENIQAGSLWDSVLLLLHVGREHSPALGHYGVDQHPPGWGKLATGKHFSRI